MSSLSEIVKALEAGTPLVIDVPDGGRRVIAELFEHKQGVVFVDIGWCDPLNTAHAFHLLHGSVKGHGPWTIGDAKIQVMDEQDDLVLSWVEWMTNKAQFKNCTREVAEEVAKSEFI